MILISLIIFLLSIPPLAFLFIVMMPLLNLKKKLNNRGKKRWAFFHPFW